MNIESVLSPLHKDICKQVLNTNQDINLVWLILAEGEIKQNNYCNMILGLRQCCLLPSELFPKNKMDQFLHPGGFGVEANLGSVHQVSSGQEKAIVKI